MCKKCSSPNRSNFFLSTDSDGKMPVLTYDKPAKRHFVRYVNNTPTLVVPYQGQERVWDYSRKRFLALVGEYTGAFGAPLSLNNGDHHAITK